MSFIWKKKKNRRWSSKHNVDDVRARSHSDVSIPLDMARVKKVRRKSSFDPPTSSSSSSSSHRDTASSERSSRSRRSPRPHLYGHGNSPKRFQPINLSQRSQQQPFYTMDSPGGSDWVFSFIYLDDEGSYESDHLSGLLWILNGSALLSIDNAFIPMRKSDCIVIPQFSSWKLAPRTAPPLVAIRAVLLTPPTLEQ